MADNDEVLRFDVRGVPELIYACRLEMSKLIRVYAQNELNPRVKSRLIHIAAAFEAGQIPESMEGQGE